LFRTYATANLCAKDARPKEVPMKPPVIFKPEDFEDVYAYADKFKREYWVLRSQKLFEQWLTQNGKVVLSSALGTPLRWDAPSALSKKERDETTHQALLICIEPIAKECEHKFFREFTRNIKNTECTAVCECGKKLRAKWEVCE
jgi:hypothetical protein